MRAMLCRPMQEIQPVVRMAKDWKEGLVKQGAKRTSRSCKHEDRCGSTMRAPLDR